MATSSPYKRSPKILLGQDDNTLVLLFAVNMIMFVSLHIISTVYQLSDTPMEFFQKQVLDWLVLPSATDSLATRPWTVITYMFTHYSFWHLVSSMLWLWCFGFILQDLAGNNKLIPVYLYGGFVGAACFVLTANLLPGGTAIGPMLGASAAVMAVAVATTMLAPDYRIFPMIGGGIPLWVLTLVFVAIDFSTVGKGNAPIAMAHLGAGLIGFFFVHQMKRGRDWSAWMINFVNWLNDLFHPEKKQKGNAARERLHYQTDRKPFEKKANITQQKLDDILDKINREGYDLLTEEEKDFLKRASKEEL
jgi:membrane associated rhomboid family serine protease